MGDETGEAKRSSSTRLKIASLPPAQRDGVLSPGTRVHRYTVLRTLARGGMGIIYLAYDAELDRQVALKLLAPAHDDSSTSYRLLREAQAMAKLAHENVVAVYDVGTFDGKVFLAMQYVDGVTLRAWRIAARRSVRAVVAMYAEAGRGLEAAHAAGILHRDFKPDNVIVDAAGRPRVLDFGVARIDPTPLPTGELALVSTLSGDLSDEPVTRAGALVGTPAYMAPEQLRGERAEARSDVFGFSVALYEAVYGAPPYGGATLRERLDAIAAKRVLPPPYGVRVPRALRAVLLKGLSPRVDDRWPSMGAMLGALDRAAEAPRRRAVVGGAVGLIVAGVGLALARSPARAASCAGVDRPIAEAWSPARAAAVQAALVASEDSSGAATWTRVRPILDAYAARWQKVALESCSATRERGVQSDEAFALRSACLDERRDELAATVDLLARPSAGRAEDAVTMATALGDLAACSDLPALRAAYAVPADDARREALAAIRREIARGTALVNARALAEAIGVLQGAADQARASKDRQLEAAANVLIGRALLGQGHPREASQALFDAAVEANGARDAATEAVAWIWLVRAVGYDLGELARSERYAKLAAAAIERAGAPIALQADLVRHRAHALWAHGDVAPALALYEEARALRARAFGGDSPLVGEIEVDVADARAEQGRVKEAIVLYEAALAKRIGAYGEGSSGVGLMLLNLSGLYAEVGDAPKAIAAARRTLAVIRPGEALHGAARVHLAAALLLSSEAADVEQGKNERVSALAEAATQRSAARLANLHEELAEVLVRRHMGAIARDDAEAGARLLSGPEANPRVARDVAAIRALCMAREARGAEAAATGERLAGEEAAASGEGSERLLLPLLAWGEGALAAGDPERAIPPLERAAAIAERAEIDPELRADAHVGLARASLAAHRGAERAYALAERAASEYGSLGLPDLAKQARELAAGGALPR